MATRIILDTDIGDDIDDAMALAFALGCPELELVGVTTVFGNVVARARQARTILKVAGERFASIPVCAGCGGSMASRPMHNIRDYLANALPNQDSSCLPEDELHPLDRRHGVDFLLEELTGEVVPVTIGAMTNLASAFVRDWRVTQRIPRIVCMAGEFRHPMAEWNIRCDPEAAHLLFSSGIPMDIIPFDVGMTATFNDADMQRLQASDRPIARRLAMAIEAWRNSHGPGAKTMPHLFDPMALATMIRPELCIWKRGTVRVELQGQDTYAFTLSREDPAGPHRIAWDVDRDAAIDFWFQRVLSV